MTDFDAWWLKRRDLTQEFFLDGRIDNKLYFGITSTQTPIFLGRE
jgi:hypothetical protein